MAQERMDRLFKEKLDNYEIKPSSRAWTEVSSKIGTKKKRYSYYWVAASVTLFVITWTVWPKEVDAPIRRSLVSDTDRPKILEQVQGGPTPIPVASEKSMPMIRKNPSAGLERMAQNETGDGKSMVSFHEDKIMAISPMGLDAKIAVAEIIEVESLKVGLSTINDQEKVETPTLKITYIASKQEKEQNRDNVGVFRRFVAFAGKISPGDILLDIKTAKDHWIHGRFKFKEQNKAKQSKTKKRYL